MQELKKYLFHDFGECLETLANQKEFDKWETRSFKQKGTDNIYKVDFFNEEEQIVFSKTIIENEEDSSCYITD